MKIYYVALTTNKDIEEKPFKVYCVESEPMEVTSDQSI